jgi:hypothetical protein
MTHAMRSNPLGSQDPLVMDLVIRYETYTEVLAPHRDSSEVVLADEIDRGWDGIHAEGTASRKAATKGIEERTEFRVLTSKMVVDGVDFTGMRLLRLREPAAAKRTCPQGLATAIPLFGHSLGVLCCPAKRPGLQLRGPAEAARRPTIQNIPRGGRSA